MSTNLPGLLGKSKENDVTDSVGCPVCAVSETDPDGPHTYDESCCFERDAIEWQIDRAGNSEVKFLFVGDLAIWTHHDDGSRPLSADAVEMWERIKRHATERPVRVLSLAHGATDEEIGQEVSMTPSGEYLAVAHEVQAWIAEHEGTDGSGVDED